MESFVKELVSNQSILLLAMVCCNPVLLKSKKDVCLSTSNKDKSFEKHNLFVLYINIFGKFMLTVKLLFFPVYKVFKLQTPYIT